jgi:hypothetical protein
MSETTYLKTACQRCSGHIEYPSKLTGQSVECPHCHQPTPLPPPLPTSLTPPPLPTQPAPRREGSTDKKQRDVPDLHGDPIPSNSTLQAEIDFSWEWIAGHYMRVRKFVPFVKIQGDTVGPRTILGYGYIYAELPAPDVRPEQRVVCLKIQHKSDFKSISNAHLDSGVRSGANELIILYEYRRGLFGTPKPCIHVAGYPAGTWQGFFEAVDRYASGEFRWPPPLFLTHRPHGVRFRLQKI